MDFFISIIVMATCYHATPGQCNSDYLTTASGRKIESTETAYSHRYMAVSRDMLKILPYGTKVCVIEAEVEEYKGTWTVADTMAERYTETIDFLINPGMPVQNSKVTLIKEE